MRQLEGKVAVVTGAGEARVADALKRLMPATTDGIVARIFKRVSPQ